MASDKSDDTVSGCFLVLIAAQLTVMAMIVGASIGVSIGEAAEREKAVKAGVARWVIDGATGVKSLKYGKE